MTALRSARASWLELSTSAFASNVAVFRQALGADGPRLGCVLKGNAYGHGFDQALACLHPQVDVIHVIDPFDALRVRAAEAAAGWPTREVVVIGVVSPDEAVSLARSGVAAVLGDGGWPAIVATLAASDAPPLAVHVHIDTGLGREGFTPEELDASLAFLADAGPEIVVAGLLTHFANTEDVTEQAYAARQLAAFDRGERALRSLLGRLGRPTDLVRHTAASAAALVLPASRLDVARVGIALYGLWPSSETRISARLVLGELPRLKPVLAWRCRSQLVKTLPAGSYVGYGCTHRCRDATRIAVLPVGYFDGYPRLLSNRAHVLVEGRRCPVVGRVMMNHLIVDVTGVQVADGGEVVATLLGLDGGERVTAEDLAADAQTIHYELTTRIGPHLERRLVP